MTATKPGVRPATPHFSSGPCAKRPGWSLQNLTDAVLGRSHRSKIGKAKLKRAIDLTRELLEVPADYPLASCPRPTPAQSSWHLVALGRAAGDDACLGIVRRRLDHRRRETPQAKRRHCRAGALRRTARFGKVDFATDVVFTWNGTTSGVRVPNGDWIAGNRKGLTICDATSAAFAQRLDWPKLDVAKFSWQKALGGEGAHGMLILSPRAVERLETYKPAWPLPKIFRLTKSGKLTEGIFAGETINTPSMLCVEDYLDTLQWANRSEACRRLIAVHCRHQCCRSGRRKTGIKNLASNPAPLEHVGLP